MSCIPGQVSAAIGGRSWDLDARVERASGEGGVLYALGNGNAGLSLFVQDDRLVFDYNAFGDHTVIESETPLPAGQSVLGVRFRRTGDGATATIVVDDTLGGAGGDPLRHARHLERRQQRGLRPRHAGERPLRAVRSRSRAFSTPSRSSW